MFAKTGLIIHDYLVWETEAQRSETTYPGPLSLLQELSTTCRPGALEVTQMEKAVW